MQADSAAPSRTLGEWLAYLEALHPKTIELGLERVVRVRDALDLRPSFAIITVGGTNGKGSTCAFVAGELQAQGWRVGLYTSPHLVSATERTGAPGAPLPANQR